MCPLAKKRQFHCQNCASACEIYKKGKAHRVLVCPSCGVIASNPQVLGKIAKRGAKALIGEIPGASLIMEGVGLAGDIFGKKKQARAETPRTQNKLTSFEKALLLERLEH